MYSLQPSMPEVGHRWDIELTSAAHTPGVNLGETDSVITRLQPLDNLTRCSCRGENIALSTSLSHHIPCHPSMGECELLTQVYCQCRQVHITPINKHAGWYLPWSDMRSLLVLCRGDNSLTGCPSYRSPTDYNAGTSYRNARGNQIRTSQGNIV